MRYIFVLIILSILIGGCNNTQQVDKGKSVKFIHHIDNSLVENIILAPFVEDNVTNIQIYNVPGVNELEMYVYEMDSSKGKVVGLLTGTLYSGNFSVRDQSFSFLNNQEPFIIYTTRGIKSYIGYVYVQDQSNIHSIRIVLKNSKLLNFDPTKINGLTLSKDNPPLRIEAFGKDGEMIVQEPMVLP